MWLLLACTAVGWTLSGANATVSAGTQPQDVATVTLDPNPGTISGCETIEVHVWINDIEELYGADIRLSFDPTVVEVVDANPDAIGVQVRDEGFLGPYTFCTLNSVDNGAGTISYAVTQLNPSLPKSGSGNVFTILLRGKAQGVSLLNFTYVKLAERNGQTLPATPLGGSVTTNPPAAPSLSITQLDETTARLSWTAAGGPSTYHLYRDTAPYFTPGSTPYHAGTSLSHDDGNALGDPEQNYYYVVRATCENGFESASSNRVGEFDYALVPGEGPSDYKYNVIALPLLAPSISDADALAAYVGGVYMVARYNAITQDLTYRLPDYNSGENFATLTGGPYFLYLNNTAPSHVTFVGQVPAKQSVVFALTPGASGSDYRYNDISIPLDQADITTADELAADMGGVYAVIRYNAQTQDISYRLPDYGSGPNMSTMIGYPYFVYLKDTAPTQWPVYP